MNDMKEDTMDSTERQVMPYDSTPPYAIICFSETHRAAWIECSCDDLRAAREELQTLRTSAQPGCHYRRIRAEHTTMILRMAEDFFKEGMNVVGVTEDGQQILWKTQRARA